MGVGRLGRLFYFRRQVPATKKIRDNPQNLCKSAIQTIILFPKNPYLALMLILNLRHRFSFILPNLRLEFPLRRNQPPMPLLYCYCGIIRRHWKLWILVAEFDFLEMPLLESLVPLLIDPLDDRPKQIVFVAIQRSDLTDYHGIALRNDPRTYDRLNISAISSRTSTPNLASKSSTLP